MRLVGQRGPWPPDGFLRCLCEMGLIKGVGKRFDLHLLLHLLHLRRSFAVWRLLVLSTLHSLTHSLTHARTHALVHSLVCFTAAFSRLRTSYFLASNSCSPWIIISPELPPYLPLTNHLVCPFAPKISTDASRHSPAARPCQPHPTSYGGTTTPFAREPTSVFLLPGPTRGCRSFSFSPSFSATAVCPPPGGLVACVRLGLLPTGETAARRRLWASSSSRAASSSRLFRQGHDRTMSVRGPVTDLLLPLLQPTAPAPAPATTTLRHLRDTPETTAS